LENGLRNRFNRNLFSAEIDPKESIKKAFHLFYLKRNLIVKSRDTDYPLPAGPEPNMEAVARGERGKKRSTNDSNRQMAWEVFREGRRRMKNYGRKLF
jgi:hypothetical protein